MPVFVKDFNSRTLKKSTDNSKTFGKVLLDFGSKASIDEVSQGLF